jgi:hypothetical protein
MIIIKIDFTQYYVFIFYYYLPSPHLLYIGMKTRKFWYSKCAQNVSHSLQYTQQQLLLFFFVAFILLTWVSMLFSEKRENKLHIFYSFCYSSLKMQYDSSRREYYIRSYFFVSGHHFKILSTYNMICLLNILFLWRTFSSLFDWMKMEMAFIISYVKFPI